MGKSSKYRKIYFVGKQKHLLTKTLDVKNPTVNFQPLRKEKVKVNILSCFFFVTFEHPHHHWSTIGLNVWMPQLGQTVRWCRGVSDQVLLCLTSQSLCHTRHHLHRHRRPQQHQHQHQHQQVVRFPIFNTDAMGSSKSDNDPVYHQKIVEKDIIPINKYWGEPEPQ